MGRKDIMYGEELKFLSRLWWDILKELDVMETHF
jgi:hypothetical protein